LRNFDFSSWQSVLLTLVGLALFTLISMGIRLLMMLTIQQRRERVNRQINERMRTLIAAYKVLGGSFTGDLTVSPAHLRDRHRNSETPPAAADTEEPTQDVNGLAGSDRRRRVRDAVEAALSDILLLGTAEQIRLAGHAISELVAGRPVHTHELVVSLRDFVRDALDLEPFPADVQIQPQGPTRPAGAGGGRGAGDSGDRASRGGGGGMGMGGGATGAGAGMGISLGVDPAAGSSDLPAER
jgi:hypothetical protein